MKKRGLAALAAVSMGVLAGQQRPAAIPETVMITFHARAGAEAELARMIEKHWSVARNMKLVEVSPHLTLRRTEEGNKVCFTDIFTWRDAAVPDNAPAAIRAIWGQMNQLVESRGGQPGLAFVSVDVVGR